MEPETAKAPGPAPLLFIGSVDEESEFVHYLLDEKYVLTKYVVSDHFNQEGIRPLNQSTPFGAQQAIIVRSDATARSLTMQLQKRCNVLTLLETKGMSHNRFEPHIFTIYSGLEFDDIIVYNFFSESDAPTSMWRYVLGLSARNESGRIRYDMSASSLSISPILCSELKQLYVAVTRARHRCWLWDSGDTIDLLKVSCHM